MARSEWDDQVVHSISTVKASGRDDHDQRVRTYLISMGIRTGSFLLAALFGFVVVVPWAAWLFMILAVVLPYPAVVWANNRNLHTSEPGVETPYGTAQSITGAPVTEHPGHASFDEPHPGYTPGSGAAVIIPGEAVRTTDTSPKDESAPPRPDHA